MASITIPDIHPWGNPNDLDELTAREMSNVVNYPGNCFNGTVCIFGEYVKKRYI